MIYCSWKVGRNFTEYWHVQESPTLMKCGARVPPKALVNRTHLVHHDELCKVCRERIEPKLTIERSAA